MSDSFGWWLDNSRYEVSFAKQSQRPTIGLKGKFPNGKCLPGSFVQRIWRTALAKVSTFLAGKRASEDWRDDVARWWQRFRVQAWLKAWWLMSRVRCLRFLVWPVVLAVGRATGL